MWLHHAILTQGHYSLTSSNTHPWPLIIPVQYPSKQCTARVKRRGCENHIALNFKKHFLHFLNNHLSFPYLKAQVRKQRYQRGQRHSDTDQMFDGTRGCVTSQSHVLKTKHAQHDEYVFLGGGF